MLLHLLIKGLIIGVIVSAPVGPIGLLCVQRTLSKGRMHGFATAIGATISDLIYAVMAVFSMSFVVDFINDHQIVLRTIACAAIFIYGLYTFIVNPIKKLRKMKPSKDYMQDALSSFFLTITNPLVILLFIALFAKLNYMEDEASLAIALTGIVFIMLGACIWWILLVTFVNQFRNRFNIRGLYRLNQITGLLLMLGSIIGLIFWLVF